MPSWGWHLPDPMQGVRSSNLTDLVEHWLAASSNSREVAGSVVGIWVVDSA
jgi:hypothetical protein